MRKLWRSEEQCLDRLKTWNRSVEQFKLLFCFTYCKVHVHTYVCQCLVFVDKATQQYFSSPNLHYYQKGVSNATPSYPRSLTQYSILEHTWYYSPPISLLIDDSVSELSLPINSNVSIPWSNSLSFSCYIYVRIAGGVNYFTLSMNLNSLKLTREKSCGHSCISLTIKGSTKHFHCVPQKIWTTKHC